MSNDRPEPDEVTARLADRIRGLRRELDYSLDELAARSGVSRSAISLIERGESSPTAVVLDRLATALDVPLAALFDAGPSASAPSPVARRADQVRWRDPVSGYRRRALSPPTWPSPIRLVEVEFPPGQTVAFETGDRAVEVHQQIYVLSGRIDVRLGDELHELATGDCVAMTLDAPTTFHNPGDRAARYIVALTSGPVPARRAS
jgi:transcriptional regulator with XRE-family HTH domain